MSKTLIINLKRFGDIYSSANIIDAIKESSPHEEISLLAYKEFSKPCKTLKGLKNIFSVDRKEIVSLKKNKIYNNGFALDLFSKTLKEIKSHNWDRIINFSNDRVSTYLTSYLLKNSSSSYRGIKVGSSNNIEYSNNWAICLNDITTASHNSPLHFNEIYHGLCQTTPNLESSKLLTNKKHDQTVEQNFQLLKSNKGAGAKIVGINISTSESSKDISKEMVSSLLQELVPHEEYIPALLYAPNDKERELIKEIVGQFEENIVTIECDFIAANSVVKSLDALVTSDTAIKHIADLVSTPVIEINKGIAPLFKQASINPKSVIVSNMATARSFSREEEPDNFNTADIIAAVDVVFSNPSKHDVSENVTFYRAIWNESQLFFIPVAGDFDQNFEINRLGKRIFLNKLMNIQASPKLMSAFKEYGEGVLKDWIELQKEHVSEVMKDLLSSIRILRKVEKDPKAATELLDSIERILGHCELGTICSTATLFFRARLEALNSKSFNENLSDFDRILFQLKSDVQLSLTTIAEIDGVEYGKRVSTPSSINTTRPSPLATESY